MPDEEKITLSEEWCQTAAITLVRMEGKQDAADEMRKIMAADIKELSVAVLGNGKPEEGLVFQFKQHNKKMHLADIVKNWRIWVGVFIVSILAHQAMELWGVSLLNWLLGTLKLPPIFIA
jgi:hypothetical protein